jgi:hypothetical protein
MPFGMLLACTPEIPAAAWIAQVGVPGQSVALAALDATDRDAWLATEPRIVLAGGGAAIAAGFAPDADPASVWLDGLFPDEYVTVSGSGDVGGLDHDLSWEVTLRTDAGVLDTVWMAAELGGTPGCDGDPLPLSVDVFDVDREPLAYDGETVAIGALSVALVIPEQLCMMPE